MNNNIKYYTMYHLHLPEKKVKIKYEIRIKIANSIQHE